MLTRDLGQALLADAVRVAPAGGHRLRQPVARFRWVCPAEEPLRGGRPPPNTGDSAVRLPSGRAALCAERFPQRRGDWDKYDAYVARHGERFEDIATTYGLTRKQLAELNGITDAAEVRGGTVLVVPRITAEQRRENRTRAEADLYRSSVPRGGEDDPLIVAVPDKQLRVEGRKRWFYRVVSGDSQWAVARAFGVEPSELARWNGLAADAHLHARMVLQVWAAPDFDPAAHGIAVLDDSKLHIVEAGSLEHVELSEGRLGRRRAIYTVKNGGTLADVGKKYGLSKYDLARINRMSPNTRLKKGDKVIVYEVVDASKSGRAKRQQKRMRRGGHKRKRGRRKRRHR